VNSSQAPEPLLHLIKLAVGSDSPESLASWQAACLAREGRLYHRTRQCPRRQDALLAGGSIYWVIRGRILVRQRLLDIEEQSEEAGRRVTLLRLDVQLVRVEMRAQRAFQGWRYLRPDDAPVDLAAGIVPKAAGPKEDDESEPPAAMLAELRALGLL
jgi:hypothetical protein